MIRTYSMHPRQGRKRTEGIPQQTLSKSILMVCHETEGSTPYLNWQISVDPVGRVSEALRSCLTPLHPPEDPGRMQEDAGA